MLLGFSDGVFHKLFANNLDRYKKYYLDKYFFNAIEMHCVNDEIMDYIISSLDKNLYNKFKYISLHAPIFIGDNIKDIACLKKIRKIYNKFSIKNIVIHPDTVKNWDIFNEFSDLPISIENMDSEKSSFKDIKDFQKIISQRDIKITLDLNHLYDNDRSLKSINSFYDYFSDKIVEYYISGYNLVDKHVPLFKTKQLEIIKSLKLKNLPIIIESDLDRIESMKKEFLFIEKNLL